MLKSLFFVAVVCVDCCL